MAILEPSEDGEVGRAEAEIRAVQDDVPEECYQCLRCLITDCSALDIISAKLSARGNGHIVFPLLDSTPPFLSTPRL